MPEGLIAPALRRVVRDQANTKVVLSEVREFDVAGRRVWVAGPNGASMELPYGIFCRCRCDACLLRPRRVGRLRAGHEDARGCTVTCAITSWVPSNWLS